MRRLAVVFLLIMIPLSLLQWSASSAQQLERLAAKGQVQEDAPVQAADEVTIHASPEKVWQLLSGIREWPQWQANVSAVQINGPLAAGTVFTWKNGSTKITSRLALVEPGRRIAWTGKALGAHAVHLWTLEALPDGETRVKTSESMDGFMLKRFYSSKELADSLRVWLEALKHKAEE